MRGLVSIPLVLCACHTAQRYDVASPPRDWSVNPAIADLPAASTLYALSDVHGGYDRLASLLAGAGITSGVPTSPSAIQWTAGDATLVVAGDLIDKGPQGIEVLDLMVALQASAAGAGGHVVVTIGNHEAEFFADPTNSKADGGDGIDVELRADAIDPIEIASGADPRGEWLRQLPFGVRVGRWFFAHAGNTKQRDLSTLEAALEADVTANDYRGGEVVGGDSLLESRDWFSDTSVISKATAALAVDHIVFGHTPTALGAQGMIVAARDGAVLRIDCGMSPDIDYSHGEILRVQGDVATAISSTGSTRQVWP